MSRGEDIAGVFEFRAVFGLGHCVLIKEFKVGLSGNLNFQVLVNYIRRGEGNLAFVLTIV